MIIVFQGTQEGKHGTAAAMVTAAAFQMARSNKKIAILSFCDNEKKNNIENFAFTSDDMPDIGNPLAELGDFEFTDAGIDALIRRSETGILTKEHFNNCSMPAVKAQNGLDIVGTTNAENFEDDMTLRFDVAKKVLTVAEELYDYIFVLADSQHAELTRKLDEVADKIVVVIRQGKAETSFDFPDEIKNKISILVADYEAESSFGVRYLKNSYKAKKIFIMPHSVAYRDACTNGSLVRFALRNASLEETPGDINYKFSGAIKELLDHVCGKVEETDEQEAEEKDADELQPGVKPKKKRRRQMHDVPTDSVRVETVAKKKRLFKKQETYDRVVIGEDKLEDGEQIVDKDALPERCERGDYVLNESPITHGEADQEPAANEEDKKPEDAKQDEKLTKEDFEDSEEVLEDDPEQDTPEENEDTPQKQETECPQEDESDEASEEVTADDEISEDSTSKEMESDTDDVEIFAAPQDMPVDEPDIPEHVAEPDFLSAPKDTEEVKTEPAPKKKKGLFSFLRKSRANVYEADFNGLESPGVDAIEEEIRDAMKSAEDDEPQAETPEEENDHLPVETATQEAEQDVFYDDDAETTSSLVTEEKPAEVNASSELFDDNDDPIEVPVSDGAPRKLSRKEKRMLREAIHTVQ